MCISFNFCVMTYYTVSLRNRVSYPYFSIYLLNFRSHHLDFSCPIFKPDFLLQSALNLNELAHEPEGPISKRIDREEENRNKTINNEESGCQIMFSINV